MFYEIFTLFERCQISVIRVVFDVNRLAESRNRNERLETSYGFNTVYSLANCYIAITFITI